MNKGEEKLSFNARVMTKNADPSASENVKKVWSCLAHLRYLVHRMEWILTTNMTHHADTLMETLARSYSVLHNDMHTYEHTLAYAHLHYIPALCFT